MTKQEAIEKYTDSSFLYGYNESITKDKIIGMIEDIYDSFEKKNKEKNIYNMKLHDVISENINQCSTLILKVHKGWIYTFDYGHQVTSSCFVPDTKVHDIDYETLAKEYTHYMQNHDNNFHLDLSELDFDVEEIKWIESRLNGN